MRILHLLEPSTGGVPAHVCALVRAQGAAPRADYLLFSDDDPAGLAASAGSADAVVLVFVAGRTRRRALREMALSLDPTGERLAATVAVSAQPSAAFALKAPFARRERKAAA